MMRHRPCHTWWLTAVLMLLCGASHGGDIRLPVNLDLDLVSQALRQQMFLAEDGSAEVFSDGLDCNALTLRDPRVEGTEDGHLRIITHVHARIGTPLGGRCLLPLQWGGVIETLEEVSVMPGSALVSFKVVDSNILRPDEEGRAMPGVVWDWIKRHVHPQLSAVTVNLSPALLSLQGLLREAIPLDMEQRFAVADSLHLEAVNASTAGLGIVFTMNVPDTPPDWQPAIPQAALTAEELAAWDAAWQDWEGFATWLILALAEPAGPEMRQTLVDLLFDARHQLRDALELEQPHGDPVRELFLTTWERLAPLLREGLVQLPGADLLHLASFISAGDALVALDQAAPHLGLSLDRHTLRTLARALDPGISDQQLAYDTAINPLLRELIGLPANFDESPDKPLPFLWIVPRAEASTIDSRLVKTLTGWVPARNEIDDYLATVDRLLEASIRAERERGKVPLEFLPLYEDLVRATAWQESCWRQFVSQNGQVRPIQSSAGSVGLMQINKHVWRGIYDLDGLYNNIAYNARAGNEILSHYLVDYAIKRGEHTVTGDPHNLARAAYAVYNGGPRHLTRYRNPDTNRYLRGIDNAFWEKYQAVREQGSSAVRQCYSP